MTFRDRTPESQDALSALLHAFRAMQATEANLDADIQGLISDAFAVDGANAHTPAWQLLQRLQSRQSSRTADSWTSLARAALDLTNPETVHAWFHGPREIAALACIGLARRNGFRSRQWQDLIARLESQESDTRSTAALADKLRERTERDAEDWMGFLGARSGILASNDRTSHGMSHQLWRLARTDVLSLACMELAYRSEHDGTAVAGGIDEQWLRARFAHTTAITMHATSLESGRAWFGQLAATIAPEARRAARNAPRSDQAMQLGDRALGLAGGWILDANRLAPAFVESDKEWALASEVSTMLPSEAVAADAGETASNQAPGWAASRPIDAGNAAVDAWVRLAGQRSTDASRTARQRLFDTLAWFVQDHAPIRAAASAARWSNAARISWRNGSGRSAEWTFDPQREPTRAVLRFFDARGEPARDLEGAIVPWMGLVTRIEHGRAEFERDAFMAVLRDFLKVLDASPIDGRRSSALDAAWFERSLRSLRVGDERYELEEQPA